MECIESYNGLIEIKRIKFNKTVKFFKIEMEFSILVLNRKLGESIIIDDHIKIKVTDIQKNSIKLALEAPKQVKILREEVYSKIEEQNKLAAKSQLHFLK